MFGKSGLRMSISTLEIHGEALLELRLVKLATSEVYYQTSEFKVECPDPLRSMELVIPVPSLPRDEGTYALELLCENELIGSHGVVVAERTGQAGDRRRLLRRETRM